MTAVRCLFDSCSNFTSASGNAGAFHSRCLQWFASVVQCRTSNACSFYGLHAACHTVRRHGASDAPLRTAASKNIPAQYCRRLRPFVRSAVRISAWCQAMRGFSGTGTDFRRRKLLSSLHLQSPKPYVSAWLCKKSAPCANACSPASAVYVRTDSSVIPAVTAFLRHQRSKL